MIKREILEKRVLSGIKQQLLTPEMVREFVAEFRSEWNRLAREQGDAHQKRATELASIKRRIAGIINAIEDGEWTPSLKQRLRELEQRQGELETQTITATPTTKPAASPVYGRSLPSEGRAIGDSAQRSFDPARSHRDSAVNDRTH
jgi:hypothetical protein